jgi:hypothetical protein
VGPEPTAETLDFRRQGTDEAPAKALAVLLAGLLDFRAHRGGLESQERPTRTDPGLAGVEVSLSRQRAVFIRGRNRRGRGVFPDRDRLLANLLHAVKEAEPMAAELFVLGRDRQVRLPIVRSEALAVFPERPVSGDPALFDRLSVRTAADGPLVGGVLLLEAPLRGRANAVDDLLVLLFLTGRTEVGRILARLEALLRKEE